jgi:hypothetical protein
LAAAGFDLLVVSRDEEAIGFMRLSGCSRNSQCPWASGTWRIPRIDRIVSVHPVLLDTLDFG